MDTNADKRRILAKLGRMEQAKVAFERASLLGDEKVKADAETALQSLNAK